MNNRYLQFAVLVILAAAALFFIPRQKQPDPYANVTDFDSCEAAGGTIVDGEPVRCTLPDGRNFEEADHNQPDVILETPPYGDLVTSPLLVKGKARGTWFFEANIPVTLKDETGKILVKLGFMATEDWMTVDYVDFAGILTFDPGEATYGVLIIEKDNPSGLPEFDASFAIPVRFK